MNKPLSCSPSSRGAIFWDYQNSRANTTQIQCLMMFAYAQGCVVLGKAYADWKAENSQISDLLCEIFECVSIPSSQSRKNRADQQLIKHCHQQVLHKSHINMVILISGDGDFTELVKDLQSHGKRVIVISQSDKNTNRKLKEAADEFYTFSQIEERFSSLMCAT